MQLEYFLMLDHVDEIDISERTIKITSTVPEDSTVFEGHFPGMPLVPGVLLIETMAQSAGLLYIAISDFKLMPVLMSVDKAKIRQFVEPNAVLEVSAQIEHDGSGFFVAKTSIKSDGKRVCDAQLKLKTLQFDELPFKESIHEKSERIGLFDALKAQSN